MKTIRIENGRLQTVMKKVEIHSRRPLLK